MRLGAIVRDKRQLKSKSDDRVIDEIIFFPSPPIIGSEIILRIRSQNTENPDLVIEKYKVTKRVFCDMTPHSTISSSSPWHIKIVLSATGSNLYTSLFLDCQWDFSFVGKEQWNKQNTVYILGISMSPIKFIVPFMPSTADDYIEINNSYYQYKNAIYDANENNSIKVGDAVSYEYLFN